jgi:hypothetical protein
VAYPSGTYLSYIRAAIAYVAEEFEQFYALLQGYLSQQHDQNGAHTDITARSINLIANAETNATGNITADGDANIDGNVTSDADANPVIIGQVGAFNGLDARYINAGSGTTESHWRIGVGPSASNERNLSVKDVLAGGLSGDHVLRVMLRSGSYIFMPGTAVSLLLGENAPGNRWLEVNAITVKGSVVKSGSGVSTLVTATPTTIFSALTAGRYDVGAYLQQSGPGPSYYAAFATVISDGAAARIVSNDGVLLTITLSGTNVQLTQSSGSNQDITWHFTLQAV